jgi:DNA-directed RNA polymerase subunit RPC12/RpoP
MVKRVVRKKSSSARYLNVNWAAPIAKADNEELEVQHRHSKTKIKPKLYLVVCARCGRRYTTTQKAKYCPSCAKMEASAWTKCKKCGKNVKLYWISNHGECPTCKGRREQTERAVGRKNIHDAQLNMTVKRIHSLQKLIRPLTQKGAPFYLLAKEKAAWVTRHQPEHDAKQQRIRNEIARLKKELK